MLDGAAASPIEEGSSSSTPNTETETTRVVSPRSGVLRPFCRRGADVNSSPSATPSAAPSLHARRDSPPVRLSAPPTGSSEYKFHRIDQPKFGMAAQEGGGTQAPAWWGKLKTGMEKGIQGAANATAGVVNTSREGFQKAKAHTDDLIEDGRKSETWQNIAKVSV